MKNEYVTPATECIIVFPFRSILNASFGVEFIGDEVNLYEDED